MFSSLATKKERTRTMREDSYKLRLQQAALKADPLAYNQSRVSIIHKCLANSKKHQRSLLRKVPRWGRSRLLKSLDKWTKNGLPTSDQEKIDPSLVTRLELESQVCVWMEHVGVDIVTKELFDGRQVVKDGYIRLNDEDLTGARAMQDAVLHASAKADYVKPHFLAQLVEELGNNHTSKPWPPLPHLTYVNSKPWTPDEELLQKLEAELPEEVFCNRGLTIKDQLELAMDRDTDE